MSEDAEYMRKANRLFSEIWRMSGNNFTTVMQWRYLHWRNGRWDVVALSRDSRLLVLPSEQAQRYRTMLTQVDSIFGIRASSVAAI